jgi:hypothetical protein
MKEEIREQFEKLPEEHQFEVISWCIQKRIIKIEFITATKEEKAKIRLSGEITKEAIEQALEEFKKYQEVK